MSNFKTHSRFGIISSLLFGLIIAYYLFTRSYSTVETIYLSLSTSMIIFIFSVFPDIDSETSKPRRYLEKLLIIFGLLFSIIISIKQLFPYYKISSQINKILQIKSTNINKVSTAIILSISLIIIIKISMRIFDKISKHRGIFHNPLPYLLISIAIFSLGRINDIYLYEFMGIGVTIGFMTHYTLDKIS